MRKVWVLVRKEWAEVFRNRMVLSTVAILPTTFVFLSLGTFVTIGAGLADNPVLKLPAAESGQLPPGFGEVCTDMSGLACMELYLGIVYLLMFMLIPMLVPNSFAAYSVVGEKVSRTLEPLLATPVHTWEIIVGKAIAAVVPAVVATWGAAGLFFAGLPFLVTPEALGGLFQPHWFVAILVLGPLLATMAVLNALMLSSVAREPRTAEMLAGLVMTPLILTFFGQAVGLFLVDSTLVFVAVVFVAGLDVALAAIAVQVFDRERILTRWR